MNLSRNVCSFDDEFILNAFYVDLHNIQIQPLWRSFVKITVKVVSRYCILLNVT